MFSVHDGHLFFHDVCLSSCWARLIAHRSDLNICKVQIKTSLVQCRKTQVEVISFSDIRWLRKLENNIGQYLLEDSSGSHVHCYSLFFSTRRVLRYL